MSLINDALKKASKPGESPTPPPGAIMQPAEAPAPDYGKLLLSVFVLIVLVLIAGTFFWWQGKKNSGLERAGASDSTTTNAQVAAQPQRSKAADHYLAPMEQAKAVSDKVSQQNREGEAMADSITASPKTTTATATAQSVATPASASPAAAHPVANHPAAANPAASVVASKPVVTASGSAQEFPELKLNAIYYRLRGPSVVINGKTLKIGDSVEGAKVTDIQRTSVELEFGGQKKALTLR